MQKKFKYNAAVREYYHCLYELRDMGEKSSVVARALEERKKEVEEKLRMTHGMHEMNSEVR